MYLFLNAKIVAADDNRKYYFQNLFHLDFVNDLNKKCGITTLQFGFETYD